MNKLKILKFLFSLLALVFVSSCDDDVVGKWESMKWEYKNVSDGIKVIKPDGKDKDHGNHITEIEVTKSGSMDIVSKNYTTFWFEEYPGITYEGEFSSQFSTENCEMKIEGNTMHCEFFDIENCPAEEFQVVVTAGDIFFQYLIDIN